MQPLLGTSSLRVKLQAYELQDNYSKINELNRIPLKLSLCLSDLLPVDGHLR